MDLEEQTLHYYLKVFSFILFIFLLISSFYILNIFNKNLIIKNNPLNISKGEKLENFLKKNIINISKLDIEIIKIYIKLDNLINKEFFHYGEFLLNNDSSIIDLINIISKPSNVLKKITIVEGWSQKKLNLELSKFFKDYFPIPYNDIIADTYLLQSNTSYNLFLEKLKISKLNYFKKNKRNKLLEKFTEKEIMIIGSLLEKEGLDLEDKRIISSVIYNRLKKKMKLQIDATVIFSITNGDYELNRKLLLSDLKVDHPFNTYVYNGLPPEPISYVGKKTLDVLFENYNTDFLFYFFNNSLNRHIFSNNFAEHKKKLNEFRNK